MKRKILKAMLLILTMTAIWGCSFGEKLSREEKERCMAAGEEFLSRYQKEDPAASELLFLGDRQELSFDGFQGIFARQMEYDIGSLKETKDRVLIQVEISNADFGKAFETALEEVGEGAAEAEILEAFANILESEDCPRREFECEMEMMLEDGEWKVSVASQLSNALTGGATEYFSEYIAGGEGHEAK